MSHPDMSCLVDSRADPANIFATEKSQPTSLDPFLEHVQRSFFVCIVRRRDDQGALFLFIHGENVGAGFDASFDRLRR